MARVVGGIMAFVGYALAFAATVRIHFGDSASIGPIVVGSIGFLVAILYTISLRDRPSLRQGATLFLILLGVVMVAPTVWALFQDTHVTGLQIGTAILGILLIFVSWRMLR